MSKNVKRKMSKMFRGKCLIILNKSLKLVKEKCLKMFRGNVSNSKMFCAIYRRIKQKAAKKAGLHRIDFYLHCITYLLHSDKLDRCS